MKRFYINGETRIEDVIFSSVLSLTREILEGKFNETEPAPLHSHSDAELFACKCGTVKLNTKDKIFKLGPGDIALVPSDLLHVKMSEETENTKWIAIRLHCEKTKSETDSSLYKDVKRLFRNADVLVIKNKPHFYSEIDEMIKTRGTKRFYLAHLRFITSFCSLLDEIDVDKLNERDLDEKPKDFERILQIEDFINSDRDETLSNKELAQKLFISERQLYRIVTNYYGMSLRSLITIKRIEKAARLLSESNLSVEEITFKVGFGNKKSFHREFKKHFGETPLQYRKNKEK